jgi:uncharacterized protein
LSVKFNQSQFSVCSPPFFARGGQLQTLLGAFLPSPKLAESGTSWKIQLADGDHLIARVHEKPSAHMSKTVLLFHGLGGDIDSSYIHRCGLVSLAQGYRVVRVNFRGAGESLTVSKGLYHSGRSADMSDVIAATKKRWPQSKILVAGFSMSGNVLLNLLGGYDGDVQPDLAVVFNPAFHLQHCSEMLRSVQGRLYDVAFVRDLKRMLVDKESDLEKKIFLRKKIWRATRVADLDELVTAPAAGFKNKEEYYQVCSAYQRVNQIQIPTVVVTASDDPIVPAEDFITAKWSSAVQLHIQQTGGHLGYLQKSAGPIGSYRWMDQGFCEALQTLNF